MPLRIKVEGARKQKRSRSEIKYGNKIFRSEIFFFYMQITKRTGRFSLGREAKFELNSLASGFSFGFDQIKLQEEKLLLKTREVKEPRGKYRSGCEAEIKSWMRRAAGTTAMKISRQ